MTNKNYDFPLQQSPNVRAQELLFCEIESINRSNIFPLTPENCQGFVIPQCKSKYDILVQNSIKQLKYVINTIQQQDCEVAFSLDEIVEQSVRLAEIEISKKLKNESDSKISRQSSKNGELTRNPKTIPKPEKAINRTYIGDNMPKLDVGQKDWHNISMNELLKPSQTSNSSINMISGEKKDKENLFLNSSRSKSSQKKPVNFMNQFQSHVDKNINNSSNLSKTRNIAGDNSTSTSVSMITQTINSKPPMVKKQINQNQTQIIDQHSYLIPNLLEVNKTQYDENPSKQKRTVSKTKMNKQSSQSSFGLKTSNEYRFDMQSDAQEDFKLLIKYIKIWKKYIKYQRLQKIEKKKSVANMMRAINFYERKTIQKGIWSLKYYVQNQKITKIIRIKIQMNVETNLKKFYFKTYRKMFMREQKRKYLRGVAKSYYLEQRRFKCFKSWQKVVIKSKSEQKAIYQKIVNQTPYAAELLLEKIVSDFYIKNVKFSDDSITEIVKFHFYASKNFMNGDQLRVYNSQIFSKSIELILKQKQIRVLKCLILNKNNQQGFRNKIKINQQRKVFNYFKKKYEIKTNIIVLQFKRHERLIQQVYQILSEYAYRRITNCQKSQTLSFITQKKVCQNIVLEWNQLYQYYSKFTKSNYCYTEMSEIQFIKRYFQKLKNYYFIRKNHQNNVMIANNKFFQRYVKICFQNWAYFYLYTNKMIRVSKVSLIKKTQKKMKFMYFKALQRAFQNEKRIKYFYDQSLKSKVISSFIKRKQFKILKSQISIICDNKCVDILQAKSFKILKNYQQKQIKLRSLQNILVQKHNASILKLAIDSLTIYQNQKYQKQENNHFLDQMSLFKLQKQAFYALKIYNQKVKELRMKYLVTKDYRESAYVQKFFIELQIRYNKRVLCKQNGASVIKSKETKIKSILFRTWLNRYRRLKAIDHLLSIKVRIGTTHDIFKLWRCKYLVQKEFNFKKRYFNEKIRIRNLKVIFGEFRNTTQLLSKKRRNNQISSQFFLAIQAGRCIYGLRKYAKYSIIKRKAPLKYKNKCLQQAFYHLKYKMIIKTKQLQFRKSKQTDQIINILGKMNEYTQRKIWIRKCLASMKEQKDLEKKQTVFKILVCPEFYASNQPRQLEQHEFFKLKFVLSNWKKFCKKSLRLKRVGDQIQTKSTQLTCQTYLKMWRTQLFLVQITKKLAIPHFESAQYKLKQQIFVALQESTYRSQKKQVNLDSSQKFYSQGLLLRVVESLRMHANFKIQERGTMQYLTLKRAKQYVASSFQALKQNSINNRVNKANYDTIKAKNNLLIEKKMFKQWREMTMEENILEPANQMTEMLFARGLKKKVFRALYNNRTYALVQQSMEQTAQLYHTDALRRKAFESLAWYGLQHKRRKNQLSEEAALHFKRRFVARWVGVLNRAQILKEQAFLEIQESQESISGLQNAYVVQDFAQIQRRHPSRVSAPNLARIPGEHQIALDSIDIQKLNTSEDLRSAHDMLSKKLKTVLEQDIGSQAQEQGDKEILQSMISQIKYKYQSKKGVLTNGPQLHLKIDFPAIQDLDQDDANEVGESDSIVKALHYYKQTLQAKALNSLYKNLKSEPTDLKWMQACSFRTLQQKQNYFNNLLKYAQYKQSKNSMDQLMQQRHEKHLLRSIIKTLLTYRQIRMEKWNKRGEAERYYKDRLMRLGLFAFKKEQLVKMMQRSIGVKIQDRMKRETMQTWANAYQKSIVIKYSNYNGTGEDELREGEAPSDSDDSFNEERKQSKPSQQELYDYNFNLGEIEDHIMQVVPQQSAEINQDFNDTYGTKFSGTQVLEEMELGFEANPQPFTGYDGHNIYQDDNASITDSFDNIFEPEENMKQNLINMQIENQQQKAQMDALLRGELPVDVGSSQEVDMRIVSQKTGSELMMIQQNLQLNRSSSDGDSDF